MALASDQEKVAESESVHEVRPPSDAVAEWFTPPSSSAPLVPEQRAPAESESSTNPLEAYTSARSAAP